MAPPTAQNQQPYPVQRCIRCGNLMSAIKGSKLAVCSRCGYKDDCC